MSSGFPPKELKKSDLIKDIFNDSDAEAITVKEIY